MRCRLGHGFGHGFGHRFGHRLGARQGGLAGLLEGYDELRRADPLAAVVAASAQDHVILVQVEVEAFRAGDADVGRNAGIVPEVGAGGGADHGGQLVISGLDRHLGLEGPVAVSREEHGLGVLLEDAAHLGGLVDTVPVLVLEGTRDGVHQALVQEHEGRPPLDTILGQSLVQPVQLGAGQLGVPARGLAAEEDEVIPVDPAVEPYRLGIVAGPVQELADLPGGVQTAVEVMVAHGGVCRRDAVTRPLQEPSVGRVLYRLTVVGDVSVDEQPHAVGRQGLDVLQCGGEVLIVQVGVRGVDVDVAHDLQFTQQLARIEIRRALGKHGHGEGLGLRVAGQAIDQKAVGTCGDQGVGG